MLNIVKGAAAVLVLGLVGACGTAEEAPKSEANTDAAKPTTPKGKLKAALAKADDVEGAKVNTIDGDYIEVGFKVGDNLSNGTIRTGIANDVFAMAEPVNKSGVKFKELAFRGTFPLTDKYGNTKAGQVFFTTFTKKTLNKIQFDNAVATSFDNMENLVIDGIIVLHPDLPE